MALADIFKPTLCFVLAGWLVFWQYFGLRKFGGGGTRANIGMIELDDMDGLQLGNEKDFEGYLKEHPESIESERRAMERNDDDAGKPSSPTSPLDRSAPPQEA